MKNTKQILALIFIFLIVSLLLISGIHNNIGNAIKNVNDKIGLNTEIPPYFDEQQYASIRTSSMDTGGITKKTYIYAGTLLATKNSETPDETEFYVQDHLGSNRKVVNGNLEEQENEFYAFGETDSSGTSGNNYKYTGKELDDETGLYYYGARYYNPDLGRFIQADVLRGNIADPPSLNRYAYTQNNPLKFVDPTGNAPEQAIEHRYDSKEDKRASAIGAGLGATIFLGSVSIAAIPSMIGWAVASPATFNEIAAGIAEDIAGAPPGALTSSALMDEGASTMQALDDLITESMPPTWKFSGSSSRTLKKSKESLRAFEDAASYVNELVVSGKKELSYVDLLEINTRVSLGEPGYEIGIRGMGNGRNVGVGDSGPSYPLASEVPGLMEAWMRYNSLAIKSDMYPTEMAANSRRLLTTIHPFSNGNGRTGKLVEQFFTNSRMK